MLPIAPRRHHARWGGTAARRATAQTGWARRGAMTTAHSFYRVQRVHVWRTHLLDSGLDVRRVGLGGRGRTDLLRMRGPASRTGAWLEATTTSWSGGAGGFSV